MDSSKFYFWTSTGMLNYDYYASNDIKTSNLAQEADGT